MLEANEMKIVRKIVGKTKIERMKSQKIRESCGIQSINEWGKKKTVGRTCNKNGRQEII